MMRNIAVDMLNRESVEDIDVETVECKGLGHPDTICDALGEEVSKALCAEYSRRFGSILHHNVDKIALAAGQSSPRFGGGEIVKPIRIFLIGRATTKYREVEISVAEIAIQACRNYLQGNFFHLRLEDFKISSYLSPSSSSLVDCFERAKHAVPEANDTSFGIGYAPYSRLETLVLETADMLSSVQYRRKNPFVGEDVKVMGLRERDGFHLTVCIAFVGRHLGDSGSYLKAKEKVIRDVRALCSRISRKKEFGRAPSSIGVAINNADRHDDPASFYITVSGLSAEMGDDGMLGRGNRTNGLITPNRPMSLEAACGKNPVNHVGKIYNVLADRLAERIHREVPGVSEVYVDILSSIGEPIDQPKRASIKIIPGKGADFGFMRAKAQAIADAELADILRFSARLARGELRTY